MYLVNKIGYILGVFIEKISSCQKHLLFTKNERKRKIIHSSLRHLAANADTLTQISLF